MMYNLTVGKRLFWSVLSLFTIFAVLFIAFHQVRENEYKVNMLNLKLQDYNMRMHETLHYTGDTSTPMLLSYVKRHDMPGLRVTLIRRDGQVVYDSEADCITITHDAHSRQGFALGAVLAAEYAAGHSGMLTMDDMMQDMEQGGSTSWEEETADHTTNE